MEAAPILSQTSMLTDTLRLPSLVMNEINSVTPCYVVLMASFGILVFYGNAILMTLTAFSNGSD